MGLTIRQADSEYLDWAITDEAGQPYDLTGKSVRFVVKRHAYDTDTAAVIDTTATVVDAAQGQVRVALTPAQTAAMHGDYVYALVVFSGADRFTASQDWLHVQPTVLQATG